MSRSFGCACVLLSLLLQVTSARALPSPRCETVEIVDHEGLSQQLGLPPLVELLKAIPLTTVARGLPADVHIDLTFSPASSSIHAAIKTWADTESVELQSGRVRWLEDFQARRRTLQPMPEADAEAFRRQIVEELKKQVAACRAAVAIATPRDALPVVTAVPEQAGPPAGLIERSPASTASPPAPPSAPTTDAIATPPKPSTSPKKQARVSPYWWLSAPLALILALTARAFIKREGR